MILQQPLFTNWRTYLWIMLTLLLACIAYRGVVSADFVGLDDNLYVSANPIVQQGLSVAGVRWAFSAIYASTWQPLVWISYMLDITLQGAGPAGFHRTNLLLHLLNVVLVFIAVRKLSSNPIAAGIAALLVAIHPLHVESVAWISERKGLLSATFWWLSILAYLQYLRSGSRRSYLAVGLAMALGLMAKPMLITLPLIYLLIDIWPGRRIQYPHIPAQLVKRIWEKSPFLAMSLASALVTSYAQYQGGSFLGLDAIPLWGRIGNAIVSLCRYQWHLIMPTRLAVLYPHPITWPLGIVLICLLALTISAGLIYRYARNTPWIAWGYTWFILTLLPVLGLNQFGWHAMADRFMYIPAVGLYIALGVTVAPRIQRWRGVCACMGAVVAITLLVLTQLQTRHWNNSISLFSHAVQVTRDNWVMYNSLGTALSHAGRYADATPHFERSLQLKPDNAKALFNLGHVRFVQERWDEAANLFEKSLSLAPNYQALFNLAVTHTRRGALDDAKKAYLILLESHPQHIHALLNLGKIYRKTEKHDQAIACYRLVLETDPDNQDAQTGIAIAMLTKAEDPMPAIATLVRLLKEDASNTAAREALNAAIHGQD